MHTFIYQGSKCFIKVLKKQLSWKKKLSYRMKSILEKKLESSMAKETKSFTIIPTAIYTPNGKESATKIINQMKNNLILEAVEVSQASYYEMTMNSLNAQNRRLSIIRNKMLANLRDEFKMLIIIY